jgi:hypothetical protein
MNYFLIFLIVGCFSSLFGAKLRQMVIIFKIQCQVQFIELRTHCPRYNFLFYLIISIQRLRRVIVMNFECVNPVLSKNLVCNFTREGDNGTRIGVKFEFVNPADKIMVNINKIGRQGRSMW